MREKLKARSGQLLRSKTPFQTYQMVGVLVMVVAVGVYAVARIFAAGGTLSLTPSTASPALGSTFTVTVYENSGADAVNAVEADLTYPTNVLQFVSSDPSPAAGTGLPASAFTIEAVNTGGNGTISLQRGNQTALTGQQVVSVLTFKAIGVGPATVAFAGSSVLVRASDQANVLAGTTGGTYTVVDQQAPTVPTGLNMVSHSLMNITVGWTAATDNVAVTGYKVYRNGAQVGTSTTTSYADSGLTPGTAYTYTVAAYDGAGNNSAQSAGSSFSTVADTSAPTVPGAPSLNTRTMTSITIAWVASTDNVAVTGYKVYRNGAQVGTSATTTFMNNGLVPGASYSFTVAAYDAAGNTSAQSTGASLSTLSDTQAPATPTSVSASAAGQNVTVTWAASTDNVAVTGYVIYRNGAQVGTAAGLSFVDSNVPTGPYTYTVAARDAAGNTSTQSTAASVTVYVAGDTNRDGRVNVFDLSLLLANWAKTGTTAGDVNGDGVVNVIDLSILLSAWTG